MGKKLQNLKTISEDLHPRAKKSFRVSGNRKSQMLCVLLINAGFDDKFSKLVCFALHHGCVSFEVLQGCKDCLARHLNTKI